MLRNTQELNLGITIKLEVVDVGNMVGIKV